MNNIPNMSVDALTVGSAGLISFIGIMNKTMTFGCGKHQWDLTLAQAMKVGQVRVTFFVTFFC